MRSADHAGRSTEQLLRERDALPAGAAARGALRAEAIELNLGMAARLAGRYRGRGVPPDDLRQVAAVALIGAVDRFESDRVTPFTAFAVPTILGSLKRYLRDAAWDLRVPRTAQQLAAAVAGAVDELSQSLGRTPEPADVATHLGIDRADVVAAAGTYRAFRLTALDAPPKRTQGLALSDILGGVDGRYARVDDELELRPLIAALPSRERQVIELYYFSAMTQAAVAGQVGISQMHVSRLLRRSIGRLRADLETSGPDGGGDGGQGFGIDRCAGGRAPVGVPQRHGAPERRGRGADR